MGIFDSIFRNKIGAPMKSEIINNKISVYKNIINLKNNMENQAIKDLNEGNNGDWILLSGKRKQVDYLFANGQISDDKYTELCEQLQNLYLKIISTFIDSQGENTIYGISRDSLKRIKRENVRLPNIEQMEFDLWRQIVSSAELAELTIVQITNSSEYLDSVKADKIIRDYQVRKHFRK